MLKEIKNIDSVEKMKNVMAEISRMNKDFNNTEQFSHFNEKWKSQFKIELYTLHEECLSKIIVTDLQSKKIIKQEETYLPGELEIVCNFLPGEVEKVKALLEKIKKMEEMNPIHLDDEIDLIMDAIEILSSQLEQGTLNEKSLDDFKKNWGNKLLVDAHIDKNSAMSTLIVIDKKTQHIIKKVNSYVPEIDSKLIAAQNETMTNNQNSFWCATKKTICEATADLDEAFNKLRK